MHHLSPRHHEGTEATTTEELLYEFGQKRVYNFLRRDVLFGKCSPARSAEAPLSVGLSSYCFVTQGILPLSLLFQFLFFHYLFILILFFVSFILLIIVYY